MSAFNQFLVAVVSFTKRVYKISRRFKSASGGHIANEPHDWSAAYQSKASWEEIRHEFRELREQELCQDSIVLRDFQTGSAEDVKEKFAWLRMSERLSSEWTCENSQKNLFRAKLLDCDQRRMLLDCAINLKLLDEFVCVCTERTDLQTVTNC